MALNKRNIKKWYRMIMGKSILHVNQGVGKIYSKTEIAGYYNDLTEKVLKSKLDDGQLPLYTNNQNYTYEFSIGIFQYGLAAYDLFLINGDKRMIKKFKCAVDWAIKNQNGDGGWMSFPENNNKFSSMAQGEGISLLIRAYVYYKEDIYKNAASKAVLFMMKSIDDGGVTKYHNDEVLLCEYPDKDVVLNGWIFSVFGLFDYLLIDDDKNIQEFYEKTLSSLKKYIGCFDIKYWSKYDLGRKITSPFYHKLHIALLEALSDLTGDDMFLKYSKKWQKYYNNKIFYMYAFAKKGIQKILEK